MPVSSDQGDAVPAFVLGEVFHFGEIASACSLILTPPLFDVKRKSDEDVYDMESRQDV